MIKKKKIFTKVQQIKTIKIKNIKKSINLK